MYCLRCGYKNDDNATVCKNCNSNIQESQSRYNYDYNRNDHHDQMIYSYKYSNNGKMPERKENDCEDQLDYRYKYSYGTNPPKTNYNTSDNQYNYSQNYLYANTEYDTSSDSINDLISGDEKYFKAYIGPGFESIRRQKFSFSTLLFGPFYFFKRQMFAYSLLWIFLIAVINHYYPDITRLAYFLINLFMATKFKKIYISFVDKKIEKIKLQSLDLSTDEIIKKCEQKAAYNKQQKTSKGNPKAAAIFIIFIFAITVIPTIIEVIDTFEYDYSYQEEIINQELKYDMPQEFEQIYKTDLSERYIYNENGEYATIEITKYINTSSYYDTEEFLKYNTLVPLDHFINTRLINDKQWTTSEYSGKLYYAIILPNKTGYIIKIEEPVVYGQAHILIDKFINSLRIA